MCTTLLKQTVLYTPGYVRKTAVDDTVGDDTHVQGDSNHKRFAENNGLGNRRHTMGCYGRDGKRRQRLRVMKFRGFMCWGHL